MIEKYKADDGSIGKPPHVSAGLTVLQLMAILAVVGIVAWLVLNQFAT